MPKIEDLYAQLKSTIVGTRTQKIDKKLDQATKDIIQYKANSGRVGYINLVKSVIAKSTDSMGISPASGGIFSQATSGPTAFGQGARLNRYKVYEAIISNITYCHRALMVLTDNILSPDDITKRSLDIKPKTFLEDALPNESRVKRVKTIIKQLKLEERLDIIIKNTLGLGDFFCEIASAKTALTSKTILAESQAYLQQLEEAITNGDIDKLNFDKSNIQIQIDYRSFNEIIEAKSSKSIDQIDSQKTDELDKKVKNLNLVFHNPSLVVKLQSSIFPICFGYLVFPNITAFGVGGPALEDEMVNQICTSIIKSVEKKIPQMKEFKNNKELADIIHAMVRASNPQDSMEIRYVPPDKMVHFKIPSTKYHPYGESILDPVQYTGKVLMALETALAIQRLARSTEKRKIAVEIGLPRDARNVIEGMKEEFRKRKVSLDSFGTVDTIPCLGLDTEIKVNDSPMKLRDIIDQFDNGNKNMIVHSYNFETGKVVYSKIINATVSGRNVSVLKVTIDSGEVVYCTPEHNWLLIDGTYKEAKYLTILDPLMPYKDDISFGIMSVEECSFKMDVGDIEVETYHNFALQVGVIIRNSQISTFEDVYIPQKDGKPFVDISTFNEGNVDVRSKVDELQFMRDQLISGMGVPPGFLGVDATNLKGTLSEENILFARTVIGHQKYLTHQLTELVQKIFDIIDPEEALTLLDNIEIGLPTPKSLQFEREARYMNEITGLIDSLERIGIPKEYSKKKYLPHFDWDEIKKYDIDEKVEKAVDPSKKDDDLDGVGGIGGMGGASF